MNTNKAMLFLSRAEGTEARPYLTAGYSRYCSIGLLGLLIPLVPVHAAQQDTATTTDSEATFNSRFLNGKSRGEDLSRFAYENPILAGTYSSDTYVNGHWQGSHDYVFRNVAGQANAETCFSMMFLEQLGVDTTLLHPNVLNGKQPTPDTCLPMSKWLPLATAHYDSSTFRMDINVPQAFMHHNARGYVNPKIWDHGITAGKVTYNFNAYQSDMTNGGEKNRQQAAYLSLNTGFNIGDWQFRHDSSLDWQNNRGTRWQKTATYARYPVQRLRGQLTLGDSYTSGELFDSVGFRGIQLATDDRMLPDSLNGYAPTIRAVADTNALVEVYQNGQLIYQTNVSQGPFVIEDLYPTGYGGDLQVIINEANGQKRSFRVPYASVSQMLRPGVGRYNVTVGQVRNVSNIDYHPNIIQATFQRGLTNTLTGYTGAVVSEEYSAVLGGAGVSTPIGAFSLDIIQSNARFLHNDNMTGQSYKLGYNKYMPSTNTSFTFAAYRYSTSGYMSLNNSFLAHDYDRRRQSIDEIARQRNELQISLSQGLAEGWGSLYLSSSVSDYWNQSNRTKEYQLGYNNSIGNISYSLSALRTRDSLSEANTHYYVTASMPIGSSGSSTSINTTLSYNEDQYESSQVGLNGTAGRDGEFSYAVTASDYRTGGQTGALNGQYNSRYSNFNASYSQGRNYHQASVGASGTIVAHSHGLTLTPQRGDTVALIEAPGAAGAIVGNASGIRINDSGYAVLPYVTPYRLNTVTLDPRDMSNDVELQTTTRQVAPYAGAIVRVNYPTQTGTPMLIKVRRANGEKLPFGTTVVDSQNQNVGIVGQGSRVFLRSNKTHDRLNARWGDNNSEVCTFEFSTDKVTSSAGGYKILEAQCEE